jgi:xanthosine utilization system XapX-like protein
MSLAETPVVFALLCVNTLVGAVLMTAAYDLTDRVLGWTGWIAGAVGGGVVGWVVVPRVASGTVSAGGRIGFAASLVLIGAFLGRGLLPLVARFAVAISAFLFSTLATLVLTVGESVLDRVYDPAGSGAPIVEAIDPAALAGSGLFAQPAFRRFLLASLLVGIVAGILAMRYSDPIISLALTGLGAGVLATAYPVWRAVLAGEALAITQQAAPSIPMFLAFLVGGAAIQYLRHGAGGDSAFPAAG